MRDLVTTQPTRYLLTDATVDTLRQVLPAPDVDGDRRLWKIEPNGDDYELIDCPPTGKGGSEGYVATLLPCQAQEFGPFIVTWHNLAPDVISHMDAMRAIIRQAQELIAEDKAPAASVLLRTATRVMQGWDGNPHG